MAYSLLYVGLLQVPVHVVQHSKCLSMILKLCLIFSRTRLAGLKGLRGVIKKIGHQDSVQLNIWDIDHMNKIVPPFLFNMQHYWLQHCQARSGEERKARPSNGRYILKIRGVV